MGPTVEVPPTMPYTRYVIMFHLQPNLQAPSAKEQRWMVNSHELFNMCRHNLFSFWFVTGVCPEGFQTRRLGRLLQLAIDSEKTSKRIAHGELRNEVRN